MYLNRISVNSISLFRSKLEMMIQEYKAQFVSGRITATYLTDRVDCFSYMIYLIDIGKITSVERGSFIDEKV